MNKEDIEHLIFIYSRLLSIHKEDENVDYILKFKKIIESMPFMATLKITKNATNNRTD